MRASGHSRGPAVHIRTVHVWMVLPLLLALAACGSKKTGTQVDAASACGDMWIDPGEECDHGIANSDTLANACRTTCRMAFCGDRVVDSGEECDGESLADASCETLGFRDGTLACTEDCGFDTSGCRGCGDGFLDANEECDGDNLAGLSCLALGHSGGTLSCQDCVLDVSGCSQCGNGVTEEGEACDDGDTVDNLTCSSDCQRYCGDGTVDTELGELCDEGPDNEVSPHPCRSDCSPTTCGDGYLGSTEACDDGAANSDTVADACRTDCTRPSCGDGVKDTGEGCDGADYGGRSCTDYGYVLGAGLACTAGCSVDATGCVAECGNQIHEPGEACDGPQLGGISCVDYGYSNPVGVVCDVACGADPTSCGPTCGDGVVEPGEQCDDGNTVGGDGCRADCLQNLTVCGDGVVDSGEGCDDGAANSASLPDACRPDCQPARCGDGVTDSSEGCDSGAANSDTTPNACRTSCQPAHCGDGVLDSGEGCDDGAANSDTTPNACRTSCQPAHCGDGLKDTGEVCDDGNTIESDLCLSTCIYNVCGDGFRRAGVEECDSSDLGGQTCLSLGFESGDLICGWSCTLWLQSCVGCGNSVVEGSEACDGDELNSETCLSLGFDGGTLACDTGCGFDTSSCTECGDGIVGGAEQCDTTNLGGMDCVGLGYASGVLGCQTGCLFDVSGCQGSNTGLTCADAYELAGQPMPVQLSGSFTTSPQPNVCDLICHNAAFFKHTTTVEGWYRISVQNHSTSGDWLQFGVWETANCDPFGPNLLCRQSSTSSTSVDLYFEAGKTYLLMPYTESASYPMEDPEISVELITFGPAQHCSTAMDITGETFPHQVLGSFPYSMGGSGYCGTGANYVWFTYTAPATGWYDVTGENHDPAADYSKITVFEGTSCEPFGDVLTCHSDGDEIASYPTYLEAGQTYLIRLSTVWSVDMTNPTISVTPRSFNPGEVCDTAVDISGQTMPQQLTGLFEYEMHKPLSSCASSLQANAVWFTYTAQQTGPHDLYMNNHGPNTWVYSAVYEGTTCHPRGPEISCTASGGGTQGVVESIVHLDQGQSYVIVMHTTGDQYETQNPEIAITDTVVGTNSSCVTALDLSGATMPHTESAYYYQESDPGGLCLEGAPAYNQAWFSYTPATTGWYELIATNNMDPFIEVGMALYQGASCAPSGLEMFCQLDDYAQVETQQYLLAGQTYLLQVFSRNDTELLLDPEISILPSAAARSGEHCGNPADLASPYHSVSGLGHDCWYWSIDTLNADPDRIFACEPGASGGDYVVEVTTGPTQTSLTFDATIVTPSSYANIVIDVVEGDCYLGSSVYCDEANPAMTNGPNTLSGTFAVSPSTTYYLWSANGWTGANTSSPSLELCVYE